MYDELKERCRACSQGCIYPSECSYFDKPPLRCMRQLLSEAADAIEELSRDLDSMNEANIALYGAMPKWIPVTERLPLYGDWVFGIGPKKGYYVCEYRGITHFLYSGDSPWFSAKGRSLTITHWMPLPEPPKEEGE